MEGERKTNLDRELECASHIAPPPLQGMSFSCRTGVLISAHMSVIVQILPRIAIYTSGTTGLPKACHVRRSR